MTASDVKKLKELEVENRWLKRMFADLSLKQGALRITSGKALGPDEKRDQADARRIIDDWHALYNTTRLHS